MYSKTLSLTSFSKGYITGNSDPSTRPELWETEWGAGVLSAAKLWVLKVSFQGQGGRCLEAVCERKEDGLLMGYSFGLSLPWVLPQLLSTFQLRKWLCVSHRCAWPSGLSQFTSQGGSFVLRLIKTVKCPPSTRNQFVKPRSDNSSST